MINLKEFKQAVLQKAMQGKLTKQLPSDGNAKDLLVKIANRKRDLVQAGKLKSYSKSLPPVTSKEIPFKIPNNWEWTRLGNLVNVLEVPTIPKYKYKNSGIPFYRIKDVVTASRGLKPNITAYINKKDYFKGIKNKGPVSVNDLLITATGTLGISCIIKSNKPMYFQGSNNILWIKNSYKFNAHFLNMFFRSQLFYIQINNSSEGSTIKHLSIHLLSDLPIPLPPLIEQQRIVSKVHKCFLLADTIQKERELHQKFAHDMKQSLLLEAMKGHLTQQLPSDGNADDLLQKIQQKKRQLIQAGKIRKHKKLPPISNNEIPFKIPKNWKWVRLLSLYDFIEGNPQKGYIKHKRKGYIRLYSVRDYNNNPRIIFIKKSKAKKMAHTGDLLLPKIGGSLGKIFIAHSGAYSANLADVVPIIKKTELNKNYLLYYLYSNFYQSFIGTLENKSAQAYFSNKDLLQLIIPIPPLSEQHRIVSKLHDLFDTINA